MFHRAWKAPCSHSCFLLHRLSPPLGISFLFFSPIHSSRCSLNATSVEHFQSLTQSPLSTMECFPSGLPLYFVHSYIMVFITGYCIYYYGYLLAYLPSPIGHEPLKGKKGVFLVYSAPGTYQVFTFKLSEGE